MFFWRRKKDRFKRTTPQQVLMDLKRDFIEMITSSDNELALDDNSDKGSFIEGQAEVVEDGYAKHKKGKEHQKGYKHPYRRPSKAAGLK